MAVPRHQLFALVLLGLLAVGHGADFRVVITKLTLDSNCKFVDSDNNEEWGFGFTSNGRPACHPFFSNDNTPWTTPSGFSLTGDFSTNTGEHRMPMSLLEKTASGPMCEFANGDNINSYVSWEQPFTNLATLDAGADRAWSSTKTVGTVNSGVNCGFTVEGVVQRKPVPGTPRIKTASFRALSGNGLELKIEGYDLNPDPQEAPVVQLTGITTECIASTVVLSDTEYKCTVTNPPSDEVERIQAQVQVQTKLGISRTATVSFPDCSPTCLNDAVCWWYTNPGKLQCECPLEYYGTRCETRYPDDQPILTALAPVGTDVSLSDNQNTLFAMSGRVWPAAGSGITALCVVTWEMDAIKLAADGKSVESDPRLVWSGPVQPLGSYVIPYVSSLEASSSSIGVCVVPAKSFVRPNEEHLEPPRRVFVAIHWKFTTTGVTIQKSQQQLEFLLYGAISAKKSVVSMEMNEADGEVRLFRKQHVYVSFLDERGRNRAGSDDSELFSLSFFAGPSTQPQVGIQGGVTKHFHFENCLVNSIDPDCAYYELEVAFDLSGTYLAQVFYFAPDETTLIKMGDVLTFEVRGFGEATLPVPPPTPSSIAWADALADREKLPLFDAPLAQTLSPNTGAADRSKVLDPLFKRWQGRWFSQRQTVSLMFESAMAKATFGSVHVMRQQGLDGEPQYCDTHFDILEDSPLMQSMKPWHRMDSVPNKFTLSRMTMSESDCVTGITVNVLFVHSTPSNVRITLTRSGPASAAHRARSLTSTVVLKQFGDSIASWTTVQFTQSTTPNLGKFVGRPALAEWVLEVEQVEQVGTGFMMDWWIDVETQPCLSIPNAPEATICGTGGGQIYARAKSVNDTVRLECPFGSVISEIVWARYGRIEGSCDDGPGSLVVHDGCQADADLVRQRVASQCPAGYSWCDVTAVDVRYGAQVGEPFLCAGEEPPCAMRRSLLPLGGSDYLNEHREHHEAAGKQPWAYPGTEDDYLKRNMVRHATEPFFRPRSLADERGVSAETCSVNPSHPKKALIVQARCSDAPVVDQKMLMASVSADLDNDYKDETVTLFGFVGGALHAAFTFVGTGSTPTTYVLHNLAIGSNTPAVLGGQIEMQAGDFDNDGYPEIVMGFVEHSTGQIKLYRWDLKIESSSVWGGLAKPDRSYLQPCGCFSITYKTQLRSLFAQATPITLPNAPSLPLMVGSGSSAYRLDSPGFSYALAAGDVGFVGYDVLSVAWIEDKSTVRWGLFRETPNNNNNNGFGLIGSQPLALRGLDEPNAVALTLGNFEGSGAFELALAISAYSDVTVYLYSIDQTDVDNYPMNQIQVLRISDAPWQENANVNLKMVAGDLNDDGDHELVVGFTFEGQARLFQLDGIRCDRLECMELIGSSQIVSSGAVLEHSTRSPELKLAIGNVDDSYVNELVMALEYRSTVNNQDVKVMLLALNAQPDPNRPFTIKGRHCYSAPSYRQGEELAAETVNNIALTVGNLYGLGFRVGEPRTVRYESVPELLAVVNVPPSHYDILNGEEIIVNPKSFAGYGSFTKLSQGDGVMSSFEVTTKKTQFEVQSGYFGFDMHVAIVKGGLDYREKKFVNTGLVTGMSHVEKVHVSRELSASGDDVVLYVSTTKDRWSYPIVDQNDVEVGSLDIWLSSSCGEECVQVADGRDLWWFTPDHEPFNMLTYSSRAPTDFSPAARIMVGDRVTMGTNEHHQQVTQESGRGQHMANLDHSGSDRGVGGYAGLQFDYSYSQMHAFMGLGPQHQLPLGVHVGIGGGGDKEWGDETESQPDARMAMIERNVAVATYLEPINPEFAYRVQPFVWMARGAGSESYYLKVDYCAEPGYQAGVSTWWASTYNKPDPAFNLPWWWTTFKRDRTMLTKEMFSTPSFPEVGDTVEVTVTVRNKALVAATNVRVTLWRGNPDNCFSVECLLETDTLIGASTINMIPGQTKREVSFLFTYDGVQNIHATIDDNSEIDEMHEDNNHAYALLFHNKREAGFTLQTLRLDKHITLTPQVNSDGTFAGGYIVAMNVLGDAFTYKNVIVQLWHGAVGPAGRLIATLGLPRVAGSVTSQTRYRVAAYWEVKNPRLYGQQELHAVILQSGFDTAPANIISHVSQMVTVACYGEVDACGECGGGGESCAGCDGVPHSGAMVDTCGVCGGDNSTCCVPLPAQAKLIHIRLRGANSDDASAAMVRRAKVGDMVVWENLLEWDVEIKAGLSDAAAAAGGKGKAFELSALRDHGQALAGMGGVPSDQDINVFIQTYESMQAMKDHVEQADLPSGKVQIPVPDSTNGFLRRRRASNDEDGDLIWRVSRVNGFERSAPEARSYADDEDRDDWYAADDVAVVVEQYAMDGVCCLAGTAAVDYEGEVGDAQAQMAMNNSRSLRSLVLSQLKEHKRELTRREAVGGGSNNTSDTAASRGFYNPSARASNSGSSSATDVALEASATGQQLSSGMVRCLCPTSYGGSGAGVGKRNNDRHGTAYGLGLLHGGVDHLEGASVGRLPRSKSFDDRSSGEPWEFYEDDLMMETVRRRGSFYIQLDELVDKGFLAPPRRHLTMTRSAAARKSPLAGGGRRDEPDAERRDPDDEDGREEFVWGIDDEATDDFLQTGIPMAREMVDELGQIKKLKKSKPWNFIPDLLQQREYDFVMETLGYVAQFKPGTNEFLDAVQAHMKELKLHDPRQRAARVEAMFVARDLERARLPRSFGALAPQVADPGGAEDDLSFNDDLAAGTTSSATRRRVDSATAGAMNVHHRSQSAGASAGASASASASSQSVSAGASAGLNGDMWGLFDFNSVSTMRKTAGPGVLAPGEASMAHRFFSPGVYLWHDARHPALKGVLVITPSDRQVDACGVCGGDSTACLDCAGVLNGPRVWDACGQCVDPTDPNYAPDERIDCAGVCDGTHVTACGRCVADVADAYDCNGECGGPAQYDCAQVCGGSAVEDCAGECGGTAVENQDGACIARRTAASADATDNDDDVDGNCVAAGMAEDVKGSCCKLGEMDCAGVCGGTSRINPCGVCAVPEQFMRGADYWVDCAQRCGGRAVVDDCGVCAGGSTGISVGAGKDCAGVCFGNATLDDCGVCYVPGDGHTANSGMDCAGRCGGKAMVDDCGMCVMGTTRRTYNYAMDCVGQCFGGRPADHPCAKEQLDACFECNGDNSTCAGCDGVPNSEAELDLCGVCGGDNSACCFLSVAQVSVHVRGASQAIANDASVHVLDAGETLTVTNLDSDRSSYTYVLLRLDLGGGGGGGSRPDVLLRKYAALQPGHKLSVVIAEPGEYELAAMESASATVRINVRYNAKRLDARTGRCVYNPVTEDHHDHDDALPALGVGYSDDREQTHRPAGSSPPESQQQQLQSLVVLIVTIVGCVTLMVLAVSAVVVSVIKSSTQSRRNHQHQHTTTTTTIL